MIEYLTYKGKQLPICVSFNVLDELKKKNINLMSVVEDITLLKDIFYPAYISGCVAKDITPEYTEKDVNFILDECYLDFMKKIPLFFDKEQLESSDKKK